MHLTFANANTADQGTSFVFTKHKRELNAPMDYFVWILMLIGWVYLVTEAAILAPVRIALSSVGSFLEALIYCPSCVGFWVGCGLAATGWWPHGGSFVDGIDGAEWWGLGESGIAAMAVASTWTKLTGGSTAWQIERGSDDSTQASQTGKEGQ